MTMPDLQSNGSKRLIIRLMEERDLEDLRILHNHDDVLMKLSDPTHVTQVQQKAWYQSASQSKTTRRYVARLREENDLIGMFRVDSIDFVNGNAFVGCDVVPAHQGRGYATEFYHYMLDYLFDACRLHRVELVTLKDNNVAQNLYKKLGFKVEGERRDAIYRDGTYKNLIAMGLLDDEWRMIRGAIKNV